MESVADSVRHKRFVHVIPYVFLLYIVAFVDRANVGYAALQMNQDLNFGPEVFGFGAGIFFVGYFLLEIPSTIIIERWSARKWIARILITWGIIAALIALVRTPWEFYALRFLLGMAEAGFFPGIILYLTHWYRQKEQAQAIALFMTAVPIANIIGAPVSGFVLDHVAWLGLAGWQWVFIVEAVPAIVFGILNAFLMVDRPRDASWLTADEKDWLEGELRQEAAAVRGQHAMSIWEAMRQRQSWVLTVIYFCLQIGSYGFVFWLPQILKQASGLPNFGVALLSTVPYIVGLVGLVLAGQHSDRTGERRWHLCASFSVAALGLLGSAVLGGNLPVSVACLAIAAFGIYSANGPFWALPSTFLTDEARAAGIGMVNSVGNLGGFVGPSVVGYLAATTNSFFAGLLFMIAALLVGAACTFMVQDRMVDIGVGQPQTSAAPIAPG